MTAPEEGAAEFLRALGRYLSVARLYDLDHPTREKASDEAYEAANALLQHEPHATFSFLPDRVVHRDTPLDAMESWPWSERLAAAGIQRLEVSRGLRRDEHDEVLQALASRLSRARDAEEGEDEGDAGADEDPEEVERTWRNARFGTLGMETRDVSREDSILMEEEAEAVEWIHRVAAETGKIPVDETLALVRSLSVAMRGAHRIVVPFVRLKETDQYTAAHCINVSILSMSLADSMDFPTVKARAIGAAGLLHDVGKMEVPEEILNKPGDLTEEEWREMQRHSEYGAEILLESGRGLDLPAVVAYEHHVGWQGGGYPSLHYDRTPLPESRLVQVCDFYDAMRTRRRYREPLPPAEVVQILRENEGTTLDPQFVPPFTSLIERWDPSAVLAEIRPEDEEAEAGEARAETPETLP